MISLDSRLLFQSLISEPVFALPLLALLFNGTINQDMLTLIFVFQMLSVFSMQLGKHSPPEFSSGSIAGYLVLDASGSLALAVLSGIIASYALKMNYQLKVKVICKIDNAISNDYMLAFASICFSFIYYYAVYALMLIPGSMLFIHTGNLSRAVMVSMPLFFLLREYSAQDRYMLFAGIIITGVGLCLLNFM